MKHMRTDIPDTIRETGLQDHFRYWRGRSGKRYLFSIVDMQALEDYTSAVVLLVARRGDQETILASGMIDRQGYPDLDLAREIARFTQALLRRQPHRPGAAYLPSLEAHIHLLSDTGTDRAATLCDLDMAHDDERPAHAA